MSSDSSRRKQRWRPPILIGGLVIVGLLITGNLWLRAGVPFPRAQRPLFTVGRLTKIEGVYQVRGLGRETITIVNAQTPEVHDVLDAQVGRLVRVYGERVFEADPRLFLFWLNGKILTIDAQHQTASTLTLEQLLAPLDERVRSCLIDALGEAGLTSSVSSLSQADLGEINRCLDVDQMGESQP